MTAMGVTVFCNRVQLAPNDRDQQQLMLLRTLQDNESNIITNRAQNLAPLKNCIVVNGTNNNNMANQDQVLAPYVSSRLKKHGKNGQPPPVAVARRNARERNRVKQVNDGFAMLREKIPSHVAAGYGDRGKKLSKVETLRMAVDYIRALQRLLAEADGLDYESSHQSEHNLQTPSPAGSGFSGSTHNGSNEFTGIKDDQDAKIDDNEYLMPEEEEDEEEDDENRNIKRDSSLMVRLSPTMKNTGLPLTKRRKGSPMEYYGQSIGDEENVEPNDVVRSGYPRFSPNTLPPMPVKSEFHDDSLHSRVVSPYGPGPETGSETTNPEEGPTTIVYASNLEPLSGTLYYKHEIAETAEFMDVVSWWEQEQGRLVHHTQPHAQRLTHV